MPPAHGPCCGTEAVSLVSCLLAVCSHWPQYNSCYGCPGPACELHSGESHPTSPGCRHQESAAAGQLLLRPCWASSFLSCTVQLVQPLGQSPESGLWRSCCQHTLSSWSPAWNPGQVYTGHWTLGELPEPRKKEMKSSTWCSPLSFLIVFFMHMGGLVCIYISVPCACLMPAEARVGCQIPENWS